MNSFPSVIFCPQMLQKLLCLPLLFHALTSAVPSCLAVLSHWRKLPQISFLSQQTRDCRDNHVFVTTKHFFCRDKSMLVATKRFVATKVASTSILLSRQKTCFVSTKLCLSRQIFVVTNVLSRQKYFVPTNIIFSRQNFCHGKHTFVATKMILMAAPASDNPQYLLDRFHKFENNAPHLVLAVPQTDRISPHLACLHWLPNGSRIHYKRATTASTLPFLST